MRKLLLFVMIAVIFTACKKDDENINDVAKSEVVFAINENGDFKSVTPGNCPEDADGNVIEPAYAVVEINGITYTPTLARVDGKLYTQSLKLDAPETGTQTYTVSKFLLYSSDDELIRATPESGSDYSEYVVKPVDFTFEVTAFNKAEVGVEVICFQPEEYSYFGFTWFGITEIELREVCFFGDICLNGDPFTPADFDGSLYGTELGVDVPAIMKIIVKKGEDQVPNSPFTNEGNLNAPLCVQYPDNLNIVGEEFTFELQLLLPDANGDFSYQTYYTYTATDDGELDIDNGDDEILDFVVGSCGYEGMADQTFDFEWTPPCYAQGFEDDTEGWLDQNGDWYGLVTRVASGNNGIASSNGNWHAIFEGDASSAPFTRFCGYSDTWTGTWTAEIDIYLDTEWTDGEGFDYTVAASGSDGNHQRDYIFHVGSVSGQGLLVNGSNNSDGTFNSYKLLNENGGNYYTITSSGWYTLQHVFYDAGGYLAVDLNLIDSSGTTVWTATRSNTDDLIPDEIGANRYGWFTFISTDGGIAVDETILVRP